MPNRIEEFEFQSRPKKPVLYNFGPEARDACMAALTLSLENFAKWQNERISPEDPITVTCDSSQNGSRTNDVDNEMQSRSGSSDGDIAKASSDAPDTAFNDVSTTPSFSASTNGDCGTTNDRTLTPPHQPRKQQLLPPPLERRFNSRRFRSASTPRRPLDVLSPTRGVTTVYVPPSWPTTPRPSGSEHADGTLTVLFGDGRRDADVAAATYYDLRDVSASPFDDSDKTTVLASDVRMADDHVESVALVLPPTSPARDSDDCSPVNANEGAEKTLDQVPDQVAPRDFSAPVAVDKPLSVYELEIKRIDENILYYSRAFLSAVLLFVIFRVMIF